MINGEWYLFVANPDYNRMQRRYWRSVRWGDHRSLEFGRISRT